MPKYVLAYHTNTGSSGAMPESEEAMAEVMKAWETWFASIGPNLLDGGNPTSFAKTVASDGSVADGGGANALTGYSLIEASDIDAAVEIAKGCPVLQADGNVEVAETIDM